jgi:hypothetical protein
MPTLMRARSPRMQVFLADVVPFAFGYVVGLALGISKPLYLVLSLLALAGAFLAGLEHVGAGEGAARGETGGLLYGVGLLLAYQLAEKKAKDKLPDPEIWLVVITTAVAVGVGALGGAVRARRERAGAAAGS